MENGFEFLDYASSTMIRFPHNLQRGECQHFLAKFVTVCKQTVVRSQSFDIISLGKCCQHLPTAANDPSCNFLSYDVTSSSIGKKGNFPMTYGLLSYLV